MTQAILKGIPTTAADWQLYSDKEGAETAAMKIAQTLSDAIRSCFTVEIALDSDVRDQARNTVFLRTRRVLDEMSDFGATDGDVGDVVARIIIKAFPC